MSGLAFYKRDPRRALRGMAKLTIEERGVYQTLQDMIYDEGGPIADDARHLAGQMMVSVRKYRAVRDALLAMGRIERTEDGRLFDEACAETLAAYRTTHQERVDSGRKGGTVRAENRAKTSRKSREKTVKHSRKSSENLDDPHKNSALALAELPKNLREEEDKSCSASAEQPRAPPREPQHDRTPKPKPDPRPLDRCLAVAGPGLGDPGKFPSLHLSAHRIAAAMAAGCDLELDILPKIAAATVAPRGDPITSWSYFDRAWADARDKRLAQFAPPDPQRFVQETKHGQRHRARFGQRDTGSIADAAVRILDRMRTAEAMPGSEDGCLDGEIVDRKRALAGAG